MGAKRAHKPGKTMRGINKVIIVGNIGQPPETRYMPSGAAVTSFSVATSKSWKDKNTGEQKEKTEWHNISCYNRLGEIARDYLKKGSQVYIEGELATEKWNDQQGITRYKTKIIANQMQMLGGKPAEQANGNAPAPQNRAPTKSAPPPSAFGNEFDDDIPF